jgi:adenylate cyclase
VIRQIPDSSDALWRAVVLRLIRNHPDITPTLRIAKGSLIRYVGPDHTIPFVSYHEVVRPDGSLPDDFFKDQVVIIGRDVRAAPDVESAQADLFSTPFTASTGWLSPGAEVHANIIETVLAGNAIDRVSDGFMAGLLALVAASAGMLMRRWRLFASLFIGSSIVVAMTAISWYALTRWYLWLSPAGVAVIVPVIYFSLGGWTFLTEQMRRRELTRAFSLYVTPQVVNQLIEHPDRIDLHGEMRRITIMFTDLAGFTSFSERLTPIQVTHLLNRHFTEMTDIILEHHGTVARFIGDAIMAFWGAPLEDEDQAYRAVVTAIAMQAAMVGQREALRRDGLPSIEMRIGIHTGEAVVGNLGSEKRFDYTAIGDDVNLAARLEGINKLYQTGIMVSAETAAKITGRCPLRPIDRVVVKGRSMPVEVFTPCDNPQLIALSEKALQEFRRQEWQSALSTLTEMQTFFPDDPVIGLYLSRIEKFRTSPPPADWDGAYSLEKL